MTRHLKILDYALGSLLRRRYKNLALLAVYAFTIAVLASVLFLTHALKAESARLLEGSPEIVVQRLAAGRHALVPLSYAEKIRAIAGVGSVTPRFWGYYYDGLSKANYTVMGVDGKLPLPGSLEGRLPQAPGECAVGAGVKGLRGAGRGGELVLVDSRNTGVLFNVTGVFRSDSRLLTNDLILMPRRDLLDFFGLPADRATDLRVQVYNPSEIDTVAAKIKQLLPDTRPLTRGEIVRTYDAIFNWRSGMLLSVFAAALIAFCILAWDKATGLSAEERREIGILKATGWDTGDVLELKFWEGLAVSLTAFLLGVTAAYLHVFFFGAALLAPVLKGWSVLFPRFDLIPYVDAYQVFVIAFLTVVPYVASTVIPSWKAAITDPEQVLRG